MSDPVVLNPVVVNEELTKAVTAAVDPEQIRAAILAEAAKQTGASNDAAAAAKAAEDKAAADKATAEKTATGFSRIEVINGKEFLFESDSEIDLERQIGNAYKVLQAVQPTPAARAEAPVVVDPAIAAKAAEDEAARKAELELQYKRGEISTLDYLEQSGAVDSYLEKKGIPLGKLKEVVDQNEVRAEAQSWEEATKQFYATPASAGWPGGDKNVKQIGMIIASRPELMNATDKVAALAQAYAYMRTEGLLFTNEAAVVAPAAAAEPVVPVVAAAAPAVPVVAPVAPKAPATSSSLFGVSSGASGTPAAHAAPTASSLVPADATPAEIIDAWKKDLIAKGQDPNAAFVEKFAARR